MHVQFVNPWALILLWLVPVIGILWLAAWHLKARALDQFLSPVMRSKMCPPSQTHRFYWQWALVLLGLLLALIAAARPQWGLREETVMQRGRDLIIALDVSRSMLAQDVHPNRLQRAKADIQDLLRALRGDRAALIAFRGKALQLCPLTTDYAYLEQALADVSPESAPRGETDIGDAITKALDAFESDAGAYQAIILISDGEDLVGKAKAAAESARKRGAVIFTVGLGDPQGAKIPNSDRPNEFVTYQGQDVVSKLQHETLKSIAEITGGAYVPVGTANVKLDRLYRDHLSKLTTRDIAESIRRRYIERYQWFLLPAVLALLAGALLSRGRLGKKVKATSGTTVAAVAAGAVVTAGIPMAPQSTPATVVRIWPLLFSLALFTGLVQAQVPLTGSAVTGIIQQLAANGTNQASTLVPATNLPPVNMPAAKPAIIGRSGGSGRDGARRAQRLYRMGSYHESAKAYLAAMQGQTAALQNDCLYNAGNALYRAGQYQVAAEKYTELTTRQPTDPAAAFYNLGCATFQLAEQAKSAGTNVPPNERPDLLERSGLAFQRTLRYRSDDEAARANLGVVTNLLPEAREQAKLKALLARYQGIPPPQMADTLLTNQRKISTDLPAALTNATPSRIDQMEALSAQQRDNTDLLIPLKISLASALAQMAASSVAAVAATSGVPQAAQVEQHIEAVRNTMQQATESLRNLENEAYRSVMKAESGVYNLWKGMAQFPQLLREDLFRQTNTINLTTSVLKRTAEVAATSRPEAESRLEAASRLELPVIRYQQNEAQELTRLFVERFSQAVPPGGTPPPGGMQPPGGMPVSTSGAANSTIATGAATAAITGVAATNAPEKKQEITAETRTNILALAQQALTLQDLALRQIESTNLTASLPNQRQAYDILKEIEKLLPKNKDQNQQQDQQKQDQQKQDQQKQDQQKQEQPPQDKKQEQQPQQQPEANQKPEQKDKDKEMTPEQARALLEKAQQREKDHREEREQDSYIPPSSVEKDW